MCLQSLGWALYRTGDWNGSIESIKKQSDTAQSSFILAMAYWQLGEKTEAMAHFDRTQPMAEGVRATVCRELKQRFVMHPSMSMLKRLQAEAAALLGVTLPTVEPAPEPTAKVEESQELPKSTPAPEAAKQEEKPQ